MSEMGELFKALREDSIERKAQNRERSARLLQERGVQFTEHNCGAHLVVTVGEKVADFWPGTGKYRVRGTTRYRRGVFNLLRDLGIEEGGEK